MKLSYSQISRYRACPLSYRLQYIDGLRPREHGYFSFGNTLHDCARQFFQSPQRPLLEDFLAYYSQHWQTPGYKSIEDENRYKALGQEILVTFHRHHNAVQEPLAVEASFRIDISGITLSGYIDRLDRLSDGLAIIDYKSRTEPYTAEELHDDLQLTLYQLATERMWGLPVKRLTIYHLHDNIPYHSAPRTSQEVDEARGLIINVAEGINASHFPAIKNKYCPCDFPEHCPHFNIEQTNPELSSPTPRLL